MRVMMIVKANQDTEASVMPSTGLLDAMGKFNEELVKAGVLLAGEGLHPSAKGKRVKYAKGKVTVVDGPFAETKELIAGFWMLQVKSMDEALEWARRVPFEVNGETGAHSELELRQVFDVEDFTTATPEIIARENNLRATVAKRK